MYVYFHQRSEIILSIVFAISADEIKTQINKPYSEIRGTYRQARKLAKKS
jgi:hypothetical protein